MGSCIERLSFVWGSSVKYESSKDSIGLRPGKKSDLWTKRFCCLNFLLSKSIRNSGLMGAS